jgi:NhaP-type Na+/H+ or K+/H+ antiporter
VSDECLCVLGAELTGDTQYSKGTFANTDVILATPGRSKNSVSKRVTGFLTTTTLVSDVFSLIAQKNGIGVDHQRERSRSCGLLASTYGMNVHACVCVCVLGALLATRCCYCLLVLLCFVCVWVCFQFHSPVERTQRCDAQTIYCGHR